MLSSFPFSVNILDTFIKVPNYLVTIILWLCHYCFARLKYILVVFRIVAILRSSHSVLLGLSGDSQLIC